MSETAASPPAAFAPSELVVLFGDRFAPEAGMLAGKEEVLTSGAKVHAQRLMEAALAAALLAVHRSGAARLEEQTGKALFGLLKRQKLVLLRGAGPSPFPPHSLEAALVATAGEETEAWDALAKWIEVESNDPAGRALGQVKAGLAERGLLEVRERKALKVFTVSSYALPDATRAAAEREPLEPVRDLLAAAEQREPTLWKAVRSAVDSARAHMTERSDD